MSEKFLIFDIWGDYAHFKKYYTTSSPLTFSIPPRTVIIGLISAIIGKGKEEYLSVMTKDKAEIAIRVTNPIKKIRIAQNLINTKDSYWTPVKKGTHEPRTQIRFEYLKDPGFRIYFCHSDDVIYNLLKMNLESHKTVYTPYLGISELIADFVFVSEPEVSERINNKEFTDINTVVPLDTVIKPDLLQGGKKYFKERIPVEMLPGRVVTEYREVLYEVEGKTIRAKVKDGIKLSNGDVITIL
jgi:CRISPR-associated protein Cas5h